MLGSAEYHTHKILLVNVSYCLKGKEAVVSFNASVFLWKQKPTSEDSRAPLIIGTGKQSGNKYTYLFICMSLVGLCSENL